MTAETVSAEYILIFPKAATTELAIRKQPLVNSCVPGKLLAGELCRNKYTKLTSEHKLPSSPSFIIA